MIFTTENSASQINSALLSSNRETEFKIADYNSIIESNNRDLRQITNVLSATVLNVSQNVAEIAEETVGNWARTLNVDTIGGPDYYIQTIKQNRGKLEATAKKIEEGHISYGPVTKKVADEYHFFIDIINTYIPAGSKLFINLIVGPVTNSEHLTHVDFGVSNMSSYSVSAKRLEGSVYETVELSGITKVAMPIACYVTNDISTISLSALSDANDVEVTYSVEGYYIKPLE